MGLGYRRAWTLVEMTQNCFAEPLIATSRGGGGQGGAALTEFGRALVARYTAFEAETQQLAEPFLDWLKSTQS